MNGDPVVKTVRKLIEVALPLDDINRAAAYEKMPGIGPHPRGLHQWWARRPLAAARAVLFAQLVDDPSSRPELFPTKAEQDVERERLFGILRELVKWGNTTNEPLLEAAREEIRESWRRTCADNADHPRATDLFDPDRLPAFHDPFAGGGAIPLEAQRLGLEAHASDLNPVAVLINKAMIEIPSKFAGRPPINPESRKTSLTAKDWKGTVGLAEDVRFYGQWVRDEAERRIGHLYPKVRITEEMMMERPDLERYAGLELTVIAWLWARTVRSPNPAFADVEVPLVSNYMLSTKKGKEAWVKPLIGDKDYRFEVRVGSPPDVEVARKGTKIGRGNFRCLLSGSPMPYSYIDDEANAGRMGARLLAIVASGDRQRLYLSPDSESEIVAHSARPSWKPDLPSRGTWASNAQGRRYGFHTFGDYFTLRQLTALTTLTDLVSEAREKAYRDTISAERAGGVARRLQESDSDTAAYADALSVYLAFAVDRCADFGNTGASWLAGNEKVMHLFSKQGIGMTWDFGETAMLETTVGGFSPAVNFIAECVERLSGTTPASIGGEARQQDARTGHLLADRIVSTDPPYYDNVGYADLSDFFYVWLRRSMKRVFPDLFATLAVPKMEELVATPYRHGSSEAADSFFMEGMEGVLSRLVKGTHEAFPMTVYYAFRQSEAKLDIGIVSTGWATFLDAVIRSGFQITGTLPLRTEQAYRAVAAGANALASSIVLACRRRPADALMATWREFRDALERELPPALTDLQNAGIAPVDLAQAAIGPGMAIFTRYAGVLYSTGTRMTVAEALAVINEVLDGALAEQEGEFDSETRWALAWFTEHHFDEGDFGVAETLFTAKNTSVEGLVEAGILRAHRGRVRLLRPEELAEDWDPATDRRLTVWEMAHHLVRMLDAEGEMAASRLLRKIGGQAETARSLAHLLYAVCDRQKRPAEARPYNALVRSWPELARLAREEQGGRRTLL